MCNVQTTNSCIHIAIFLSVTEVNYKALVEPIHPYNMLHSRVSDTLRYPAIGRLQQDAKKRPWG